jgi:hypothetical protein
MRAAIIPSLVLLQKEEDMGEDLRFFQRQIPKM